MAALDSIPLPPVNDDSWEDWAGALDADVRALNAVSPGYVHNQAVASATWVIVHNLGHYPHVHIEDSGGDDVEGAITYNSNDQMTITFSASFAGTAYLS